MTPSRLAEIKALADAATPGPWRWFPNPHPNDETIETRIAFGDPWTYSLWSGIRERDAAFIAASRTAVPELVAEVERLTALLARPRCPVLSGSYRCILYETHGGEHRLSNNAEPELVNPAPMPVRWLL